MQSDTIEALIAAFIASIPALLSAFFLNKWFVLGCGFLAVFGSVYAGLRFPLIYTDPIALLEQFAGLFGKR